MASPFLGPCEPGKQSGDLQELRWAKPGHSIDKHHPLSVSVSLFLHASERVTEACPGRLSCRVPPRTLGTPATGFVTGHLSGLLPLALPGQPGITERLAISSPGHSRASLSISMLQDSRQVTGQDVVDSGLCISELQSMRPEKPAAAGKDRSQVGKPSEARAGLGKSSSTTRLVPSRRKPAACELSDQKALL